MLSDTEQSGLFTFMVGTIVVVLGGIGLSMLVDNRFSSSDAAVATAARVEADAEILEELKVSHRQLTMRLAEAAPRRRARLEEAGELRQLVSEATRELESLKAAKKELEDSLRDAKTGFSEYREQYRKSAGVAAVGRKLGDLRIRGGREYHEAVILRVTDVGLEIRHEHGLARVQAPELDPALRDEFQWDDEERRERLKRELANRRLVVASPPEVAKPPATGAPRAAPPYEEDGEIKELLEKVRIWRLRLAMLSAQRQSVHYSSRNRSVPGGLETREAKAARLDGELARARASLSAAEAAVAAHIRTHTRSRTRGSHAPAAD